MWLCEGKVKWSHFEILPIQHDESLDLASLMVLGTEAEMFVKEDGGRHG